MTRWQKIKPIHPDDNRLRCKQDVRRGNRLEICHRLARIYIVRWNMQEVGRHALCEQHATLMRLRDGISIEKVDRRKKGKEG